MICGLGIDACSIQRCLKLNRHTIQKIFNVNEVNQYDDMTSSCEEVKAQFLASRFAVKEAYAKARGLGFCSEIIPSEISTNEDSSGKPYIKLYGKTAQMHPQGVKIHVSLTHQDPLAVAVVILEKEGSYEQS